jgi:alanyl-tRNA synthetase
MSDVKIKTFTGSGSINFEEDQREDLNSVNDAKSLSDQVVKLKQLEDELVDKEKELKELKRHIELVSGEVIPTMMQEMNISTLKLADGSSVEVKPVYGASITVANKQFPLVVTKITRHSNMLSLLRVKGLNLSRN